jgi:hypothetical protein
MKNSTIALLLIASAMCFILACRADFSEETAAVNSMLGVIEGLESKISELDTASIKKQAERVVYECDNLRLLYLDTTVQYQLDSICSYPLIVQKSMERVRILSNELATTKKQLTDLRTDMEERKVKEENVATFIEIEFLYVESLSELLDEIDVRFQNDKVKYEAYRISMDSLMSTAIVPIIE